MKSLLRILSTIFILFGSLISYANSGKLFDLSVPPHLLFNYNETWKQMIAGKELNTTFTSPSGVLTVTEDAIFANGRIQKYTIDEKQLGYFNRLEIQGNKSHYLRVNSKTGQREQKDGDWGEKYFVMPELLGMALDHWDEMLRGDTVYFRLGILEKMDSYGFKIFKDSESIQDGQKIIVLKIKPSSFIIAAVISPFYLSIRAKDKTPLHMKGLSLPKLKSGPNELRDLEADLAYLE